MSKFKDVNHVSSSY